MTSPIDFETDPFQAYTMAVTDAKFWMNKAADWQARHDKVSRILGEEIAMLERRNAELREAKDELLEELGEERVRAGILSKTVVGLLEVEYQFPESQGDEE